VDVYVEYTGTAHSAILGLPVARDPATVRRTVDSIYRARWDLQWGESLGFDNTFAMLVRGAQARELGIATLTEAAPHTAGWRPGFGYEFMERDDGFRGLVETYGFDFAGAPAVMDLGLTYRALADGQVDIIAGNSTDGQIDALDLVQLADDRGYFPPYEAAPVVRRDLVSAHPRAAEALRALAGAIDAATMRRLNRLVDVERQDYREVARALVESLGR
jgi:osmoprotectant transport system substrate-binding protein